jgi:hypothetical protein
MAVREDVAFGIDHEARALPPLRKLQIRSVLDALVGVRRDVVHHADVHDRGVDLGHDVGERGRSTRQPQPTQGDDTSAAGHVADERAGPQGEGREKPKADARHQ